MTTGRCGSLSPGEGVRSWLVVLTASSLLAMMLNAGFRALGWPGEWLGGNGTLTWRSDRVSELRREVRRLEQQAVTRRFRADTRRGEDQVVGCLGRQRSGPLRLEDWGHDVTPFRLLVNRPRHAMLRIADLGDRRELELLSRPTYRPSVAVLDTLRHCL